MKKLNLCLIVVLTCLFVTSVSARNLAIALSPYKTKSEAKTEAISLTKFLTHLQPGDSVILFDGFNMSIIGEFNIPSDPAYKSPKARLNVNRGGVSGLMQFAKNVISPGSEGHPSTRGAVRLPQLLHYAANNFMGSNGLDVIVLGSPFYDNPKERMYAMADGLIPSDGHLFASQDRTPYSAAGNTDQLKNMRVHIGYGDKNIMHSTQHNHFVKRFWTLHAELQGAKLVSFEPDLLTLFKRVNRNAIAPKHNYVPEKSSKLEMIELPQQAVAKQSIFDRPLSTKPLGRAQIRKADQVEIGISWSCGACDIDLYARPTPRTQILSYSQTSSAEGRYWKDYRHSPKPSNGYETVAFHVPLDLRVLQIALNFFEGKSSKGVSGEIRLSIDGETYMSDFYIPATSGNKGKGVLNVMDQGSTTHSHTIIIDPLQIVQG